MAKKKKPGRPPVPKAERRDESMRFAVTLAEKKKIEKSARDKGQSISDFLRATVMESLQ